MNRLVQAPGALRRGAVGHARPQRRGQRVVAVVVVEPAAPRVLAGRGRVGVRVPQEAAGAPDRPAASVASVGDVLGGSGKAFQAVAGGGPATLAEAERAREGAVVADGSAGLSGVDR